MKPPIEHEYVLGTADDELERLGFQHCVWSGQAFALWQRAGFGPGQTLVDLGCGPGYTTLDLAQIVGRDGRVIAVDISNRFIEHLEAQLAARCIATVAAQAQDVQALDLAASSADGVYARWLLCFVCDPEAVVAEAARILKPGGVFAVQDYYFYRGIALSPPSAVFRQMIEAVDRSWRQPGGDPNIGCRLPEMFSRHGLQICELTPLLRFAGPHEMLWHWPTRFFENNVPRLVDSGFLTADQGRQALEDWQQHTRNPDAFFGTPPMCDIIGVKL